MTILDITAGAILILQALALGFTALYCYVVFEGLAAVALLALGIAIIVGNL